MTGAADVVDRRAARVLLIDPDGRVLLLHGWDPARPEHGYWFTVGGGVEPGESLLDAAVREVFEETGLRIRPGDLSGPVRRDTVRFPYDGQWYQQVQSFYVAHTAAFDADLAHLGFDELDAIDTARWWSAEELLSTDERFYPADLVALLREVG